MGEILTGATVGTRLAGGFLGAQAARTQADAVSDAARFNASLDARLLGINEATARRGQRRALSSMKVAFAKNGVELSGSPLEFIAESAAEFERDILSRRFEVQSGIALNLSRADNAQVVGRQRASASLLSAGADVGRFTLPLLRRLNQGGG